MILDFLEYYMNDLLHFEVHGMSSKTLSNQNPGLNDQNPQLHS